MKTQLVGIDVSARTLNVALEGPQGPCQLEFANTPTGHRQLIRRLSKAGRTARIVLEASGIYSLDLTLALERAARIELMVVNPRAARDFAKAYLQRSKSDTLDARVLLEFARRMPFVAWQPPAPKVLELRDLARRIGALVKIRTQEKQRLHATRHCQTMSPVIANDIEVHLRHLDGRIKRLEEKAIDVAWSDSRLRRDLTHLTSVRGVARASAIQILAELRILPDDLKPRQWVAYAGLDPRHFESGESVKKPARISRVGNRNLRRALYMPALVACQYEPNIKAFYERLIARGKKPKQAIVAVMRKLLHSFHGMLRHREDFDGEKFFDMAQRA